MAHPSNTKAGMSRGAIDLDQPFQVEYVQRQFPWFSHQEVEEAIREKGPNRERVISYLQHRSNTGRK